jgi:hypothetical protein
MKRSSCTIDSGLWGAAITLEMKLGLLEKSARPLVWFRSSRSVTPAQAAGASGSHLPMVSSSASTPRSTSPSATAPL